MNFFSDNPAVTLEYIRRIETDALDNILPFWMAHAVPPEGAGFVGSIANDLTVDPEAERGALLTSRILWAFSAAYRHYHRPEYLRMAERAYADLQTRFHDRDDGGYFWSLRADGSVLQDRKQVYGQAFALYSLAEFHQATGRPQPLAEAVAIFGLIEKHARETVHGGYIEALGRDWSPIADMRLSAVDLNEPKSQNTHLHVMEAYANLLACWPNPALHAALRDLVEIMLRRIIRPDTGHLGLFFAEDWTLRSDRISYGHDIEAAWLLVDAAARLGQPQLLERVRRLAVRIAEVTLAEGVDGDGGIFNEGGPAGLTNTDKEWWPQTEAVVGFLNAYEIAPDDRFAQAALHTWDFIDRHLIDRRDGEWFRGVTREGRVLARELKVSFWKCPYHNVRGALEAVRRLRALAAQS
ncbi:MAG TPA: AGE family epimerase/isomerase [Opitutaceae bacterium]|jgi:mannobiose 2-epimerase|nr:AGE family epimerase/isomerase [Opitutaceae bacterium]